jgi:hypothetical protein
MDNIIPRDVPLQVDRTVKIWRLPPLDGDSLAREDKPLFSSGQIHKARVLSVTWQAAPFFFPTLPSQPRF